MSNSRKKIARGVLFVAAALTLGLFQPTACGLTAPNPAAPPAPPAEIPSALTFPESVNIGFGEPSKEAASLNLVQPLVPIGGEFFDAIQFGFDVNARANDAVQVFLDELNRLEIPVNPVTRTFEVTDRTPDAFFGDDIKIDFSDFNFPGKTEACTGCTCPTGCDSACPTEALEEDLKPVCYRIWSNPSFDSDDAYVPLIAGFMTRLAIEDNPDTPEDETNAGNGAFSIRLEDASSIINTGAVYEHRNTARPFDKTTDLFNVPLGKATEATTTRATVNLISSAQKGLPGATNESQVIKTLRFTGSQEVPIGATDPDHAIQYIAQFREDADFWSGTLQNNLQSVPLDLTAEPPDTENFTDQCAQLSTAIGVEQLTCEDLSISVGEIPFIDVKSSTDPSLNLPVDFPTLPTF